MHLFGRKHDHDYYFELLFAEEWDAQSIGRCSIAQHGDFGAVPRVAQVLRSAKVQESEAERGVLGYKAQMIQAGSCNCAIYHRNAPSGDF
jgi:hypothetical protein